MSRFGPSYISSPGGGGPATPSGPAGGSLIGTYPNPDMAPVMNIPDDDLVIQLNGTPWFKVGVTVGGSEVVLGNLGMPYLGSIRANGYADFFIQNATYEVRDSGYALAGVFRHFSREYPIWGFSFGGYSPTDCGVLIGVGPAGGYGTAVDYSGFLTLTGDSSSTNNQLKLIGATESPGGVGITGAMLLTSRGFIQWGDGGTGGNITGQTPQVKLTARTNAPLLQTLECATGNRGWFLDVGRFLLQNQFDTSTDVLGILPGFQVVLWNTRAYKFKATLYVTPDVTGGFQFALTAISGTLGSMRGIYKVYDISTNNLLNVDTFVSESPISIVGPTDMVVEIECTILLGGFDAEVALKVAQDNVNGTTSVLALSSMTAVDMGVGTEY